MPPDPESRRHPRARRQSRHLPLGLREPRRPHRRDRRPDGLAVVPSANSRHIMAGAGTAALELLTDHPEIETLVVPVGGGGLAAATAKHLHTGIKAIGVDPQEGADTLLSLRCGQRIALPDTPATITNGLGHSSPSPLTWAVNSQLLNTVVTVTDNDITTAMAFAFRHLKVVAEPSGARPRFTAGQDVPTHPRSLKRTRHRGPVS
ncbi:pyridoxal-phosphate dependent enzyme [Streptomyces niveus]|uniref:pyridoxal-phosphate dependent enzyme n=1 Tax=Streptomyces niveus TaxID=193462 RepID=UPI00342FA475